MPNKKISQLFENPYPQTGDVFPTVSDGVTYKVTLDNVSRLLNNEYYLKENKDPYLIDDLNRTYGRYRVISGNIMVSGGFINLYNSTTRSSNLQDMYPASNNNLRRYYPEGFLSATGFSPESGVIVFHPFLLKKDTNNFNLVVELTSSNVTNTPIGFGIYSGEGFQGARLFYSGVINTINATPGLYRRNITDLPLKKGPYIIASFNSGIASANASQFKSILTSSYKAVFGESAFLPSLSNHPSNIHEITYESGVRLNTTLGTGLWGIPTQVRCGPLICIEHF